MERFEEFTIDGKNFVSIDFSHCKIQDEFYMLTEEAKKIIAKYPKKSVYTITYIEGVKLDARVREIAIRYIKDNTPYVRYGAVVGLDSVKKIILSKVFRLGERTNLFLALSKKEALDWLLKQD